MGVVKAYLSRTRQMGRIDMASVCSSLSMMISTLQRGRTRALKALSTLPLLICFSCVAPMQRSIQELAAGNRCEAAASSLLSHGRKDVAAANARQGAGYLVSISLTGPTAATETTIYLAGATAVLLLCTPAALLHAGSDCFNFLRDRVGPHISYSWTRNSWRETRRLRFKNFDELSGLMRVVAGCYFRRGDPESLRLAGQQIASLKRSLWSHLSADERNKVEQLEAALRGRTRPQ